MKRRIIKIDSEACNGCGACVTACHEGAIKMKEGKAYLSRADYCDGLGDCLPACPVGAISFEELGAPECGGETPVESRSLGLSDEKREHAGGCPGRRAHLLNPDTDSYSPQSSHIPSRLMQWPCQIKLVPTRAPYFDGANLLIAADCTAFAYGAFHNDFMRNHITVIGCPKLDGEDYSLKLTEIIRLNDIKSVKIVRMEVPCCQGIEAAARKAIRESGKFIPWQVIVIGTDGKILQ